jgi:hypothetical protein
MISRRVVVATKDLVRSRVAGTFEQVLGFWRALTVLPSVEHGRRSGAPAALIGKIRLRGARSRQRSLADRETLRRVIAIVDRLLLDGGNCYRRALLEMALDAGAAREPLRFGLRAHGGPRSGHAWLASWPDAAKAGTYDAVLEM